MNDSNGLPEAKRAQDQAPLESAFGLVYVGDNLWQVKMVTLQAGVLVSEKLVTEPDMPRMALGMLMNFARDLYLNGREPSQPVVAHV